MKASVIATELRLHAPFTAFGTVTGIVIMAAFIQFQISREISSGPFLDAASIARAGECFSDDCHVPAALER